MEFNDVTNEQGLYQDALFWTGANTATFTIEDFVRLSNQAQNKAVALIQENDRKWKWSDSNSGTRDIGRTNLVANQDHYTLEVYHMKIKEIRIKDKNGNWKTISARDRRELSDDEKNSYGEPETYDKDGSTVSFSPIADYSASQGMEIHYQKGPVYFTKDDTTKQPGFCSLFHRLVSMYASMDWLISNSTAKNPMSHKINRLQDAITLMENGLITHYQNRDEDEAPILRPKRTIRNNGLSL
jgi:hypothetical protein